MVFYVVIDIKYTSVLCRQTVGNHQTIHQSMPPATIDMLSPPIEQALEYEHDNAYDDAQFHGLIHLSTTLTTSVNVYALCERSRAARQR